MADGAEAYGKEIGVNVTIQNADLDTATQISQMQTAIANGADGILLQSVEADGVVPAVQQANNAGIPVVAVNSGVGDGAEIVTYVGVDQVDYGKGLGQLAAQALPDGGKVAIIQGVVGNPVEVDRTTGINEAVEAAGNLEVIATVSDSWSNDENLAAVQDLLTKYPAGQIDAVIAEGPEIYVGAQYAHSIGRDDVKFIAGDFPVQVRDAIEAGQIYGTVLQDGAQQGAAGVDAVCNWITGDKDKVKQPTDFVDLPLVTSENLDQFETSWNW
jgi:ribose transport system substrate-binding protein